MAVKRLFEVKGADLTKLGQFFFAEKIKAKSFRDEKPGRWVTLGPDHKDYGIKRPFRTHGHHARSGGPGNGFKK